MSNVTKKTFGVNLKHVNIPNRTLKLNNIKNINSRSILGSKILGVNLKHINSPNNKSIKNIIGSVPINSKKILGNKMKTILGVNLKHVEFPKNKNIKNILGSEPINSKKILEKTTPEYKSILAFNKSVKDSIKQQNNNAFFEKFRKPPKKRIIAIEPPNDSDNTSPIGQYINYTPFINQIKNNYNKTNKNNLGKLGKLGRGQELYLKTLFEGQRQNQLRKHGINNSNNNNL